MNIIYRVDIWLGILLTFAILATSFFVIETAYQTRQMYSELQKLRVERNQMTIEWGRLMLERGAISADMRLDTLARQEMILRSPSNQQVILMERPE